MIVFNFSRAMKLIFLSALISINFQAFGFGYTIPSQTFSTFTGKGMQQFSFHEKPSLGNLVMYDSSSDPPNRNPSFDENGSVWSALANTERWISNTLSNANKNSQSPNGNPYSRKEISYVCENADSMDLLAAGIFRRLREMRELGESHAEIEKERKTSLGDKFKPRTFRKTFVVIMPFCKEVVNSFSAFDNLINIINSSRRNARDYVTDISIEKIEDEEQSFMDVDWTTSVSMAQLHPKFGELTMDQRLAQEKEQEGDIDLNYQAYKERRDKTRRSPYPTIVLEVRTTPPIELSQDSQRQITSPSGKEKTDLESAEVTKADLNKLEALFGQSATFAHPEEETDTKSEANEDDFYNAIAATGITEVTFINSLNLAQTWVSKNDPMYNSDEATFAANANKLVDETYEFVFSSIAMHLSMLTENKSSTQQSRNYLVLSNFLTSSSTSFEKFTGEVMKIIQAIPNLKDKLTVSTFHPEHIEKANRSPQPILVLQWKNE